MITITTTEELNSLVGRDVVVSPLIAFPLSLPVSSIDRLRADKSLSLQQVLSLQAPPAPPINPQTQFPFEDEYEVNGRLPMFNPMNGYGESDRKPAMNIPWGSGGSGGANGGGMYPDLNLGSQFPNPGSQGPRWDPPMGPSGGFNGSL